MPNDYFNHVGQPGRFTKGDLIRAEDGNSVFDGVETGLDKLPTEVQNNRGTRNYSPTDTGTANTYACSLTHVTGSYQDGQEVFLLIANTNTGASTLNVSAIGPESIVYPGGGAIAPSDLPGGYIASFRYNSTATVWELNSIANASITASTAAAAALVSEGAASDSAAEALVYSTAAAVSAATADVIGKRTIWVPASEMAPTVTAGCAALAVTEIAAGQPNLRTLNFDTTIEEHAQFSVAMPKRWDKAGIGFKVFWSVATTGALGVAWGLRAVSVSNDDPIGVAFGTATVISDFESGTANDLSATDYIGDFDLVNGVYSGSSLDTTAKDTSPFGMQFDPTGLIMFTLSNSGSLTVGRIHQWTLSVPFDHRTAVFLKSSVDLRDLMFDSGSSNVQQFVISPDGTQGALIDETFPYIYRISFSTAWDVDTLSVGTFISVSSQTTTPYAVEFSDTGLDMYVLSSSVVYQYSINPLTPYRPENATYASKSFSVGTQTTAARALKLEKGGSLMFVVGQAPDTLFRYDLGTDNDVTTAVVSSATLDISGEVAAAAGISLKPDGSGVYVFDFVSEDIFLYDLDVIVNVAGTPQDYDVCYFDIYRDVAHADDTLAADAKLIGVELFWTNLVSTDD